jgi:BirA family transcriptional regulator, biotin operon repressor / biotin---[acetyl-CoA-carboxylase] ligase
VDEQRVAVTYDGSSAEALALALSLPRVALFDEVASTMDVANSLAAEGAPAGTLVLADAQVAGRGRAGRRWESRAGDGIWLTLVERLNDVTALDVLSLRIGIRAARALDRFASKPIGLKWPNDLFLGDGKLGGVLVESRWRGPRPEWTAIGVGINVRAVSHPGRQALGAGVSRLEVLGELVPALRAAASARGHLSDREVEEFTLRDIAVGRACRGPIPGVVDGIAPDGALLVRESSGVRRVVEGSLVLD